jgi:hypothetical protein
MAGNYSTVVNYYRVNAANTAIASSASGEGSPTEEILAPIVGGLYNTSGSGGTTIIGQTGSGSTFNSLSVNQYLYYVDAGGNYILLGQIAEIVSATEIELYENAIGSTPAAGSILAGSFSLITNVEPLFVRVQTEKGGNATNGKVNMPNFAVWRDGGNVNSSTNNRQVIEMTRVSNVGAPVSIASSTQDIPFTIQTMNQFTPASPGATGPRFFPTINDFPTFVWIRITPTASATLASKTMYRLTTQESILAFNTGVNTTLQALQDNGYNVTAGTTTTTGGGGNSSSGNL